VRKADYSEIAASYDRTRQMREENLQLWADVIQRLGQAPPDARALDLGCGTGRFALLMFERLGWDTTGLDASPEMLARARDNDPECAVRWLQGDAQAPACPDRVYDLIIMSHLLHHVDDPRAVLRHSYRMLDTPGTVLIRYGPIEHVRKSAIWRFFPETRELDEERTPSIADVEAWLTECAFEAVVTDEVRQQTWQTAQDLLKTVRGKATSALTMVPEDAFERGLRALEDHVASSPDDPSLLHDIIAVTAGYKV